jgi:2-hydroxychromene-2-carboxylate isomerase
MTERVRFYFDPRCPWCYQTSRWMRHVERAGEVTVTWAVFSLAIANQGDAARATSNRSGGPALRTAVAVRAAHGDEAVGNFYAALGAAAHERGENVDDPRVIDAALRSAGVDEAVRMNALADPSTWEAVQAEHDEVVATHKAFGVPTIVLDDGKGPAIFGPVIVAVPDEQEAVELWQHTSWLVRNQNFAELKRERAALPPLRSVQRESRQQEVRAAPAGGVLRR